MMLRTSATRRPPWSGLLTVVAAVALVWGLVVAPGTTRASAEPAGQSTAASALIAGGGFTCALMPGGTVKCWGYNGMGQVGDGTTTNRLTPVDVVGISGATALAAGSYHTCALMPGGTAKCWGYNYNGRLGDGTNTRRVTPVDVVGVVGATALIAGGGQTCALISGGAAKCWGYNDRGQVGDGTTTDRLTPVDVVGVVGATALAGGNDHTCALTAGGTAKCWGANSGRLGDGTYANRSTPVDVRGLSGATGLTAGMDYTCALMSGGTAKCWGPNYVGQVGDGTTTDRLTPVDVVGLSGATALTSRGLHTCALMPGGAAKCWGSNTAGELGDGTTGTRSTPVDVVGLGGGTVPGEPGDPEPEPDPDCTKTYFVGVRGSGEGPQDKSLEQYEQAPGDPTYLTPRDGLGGPIGDVHTAFLSQVASDASNLDPVHLRTVAYPAIPVDTNPLNFPTYVPAYLRSVEVGASQLTRTLNTIKVECADARVVLAGYSQGADVINAVMADAHTGGSMLEQVEKIIVIGDPAHRPNRAENVGNWWTIGSANGHGVTSAIADNDTFAFKDAHAGLVSSICAIGDLVCDTSSAQVHLEAAGVGPHGMYSALTMACPVVKDSSGGPAWQYSTTCAAQYLIDGLGYTPSTRQGGLHADQMIAQAGTHILASVVAAVGIGRKVTNLKALFTKKPTAPATRIADIADPIVAADSIEVGTFPVDDNGTAIIEFEVPNVPVGEYELKLVGDDGREYRTPIYVTDQPTGSNLLMFVVEGSAPDVPPTTEPTDPGEEPGGSAGGSSDLFGS